MTMSLRAQTPNIQTDTLQWNASGFTDNISQETITKSCQFITYGDQKIEWVQKNGTYISTYSINSLSSSWPDLNTNGSLTYSISRNTVTGQLTITRTDQVITIRLNLTSPSGNIDNTYTVSTFEKRWTWKNIYHLFYCC